MGRVWYHLSGAQNLVVALKFLQNFKIMRPVMLGRRSKEKIDNNPTRLYKVIHSATCFDSMGSL